MYSPNLPHPTKLLEENTKEIIYDTSLGNDVLDI